jgi:hypothetical protein
MQNQIEKLRQMLISATKRIERGYFYLPVADAPPVYRERVYCYELYHQLRGIWVNFYPFKLCAEVDKSNHPHFRRRTIPDLLVHEPGNMDNNLAAIEVKSCNADVRNFKADLEKLTNFCKEAGYSRGIFLVYGSTNGRQDNVRRKVLKAVEKSNEVNMQFIEVFHHTEVCHSAKPISLWNQHQ